MISLTEVQQSWFILRGEQKEGPYEYHEMVLLMQKQALHDNDYVWNPSMIKWAAVGDLPEFSMDRMIRNIETDKEMKKAFIPRGGARLDYQMPLYGHDNHLFFQGHTLQISEGGGLLVLNTPLLQLQQPIMLHMKEGQLHNLSFNVRAKIVRKNFTRAKIHEKVGLRYAVQFTEVPPIAAEILKTIFKVKAKEA